MPDTKSSLNYQLWQYITYLKSCQVFLTFFNFKLPKTPHFKPKYSSWRFSRNVIFLWH